MSFQSAVLHIPDVTDGTVLHQVRMLIIDSDKCRNSTKWHNNSITDGNVCADGYILDGVATCNVRNTCHLKIVFGIYW